MISPFHPTVVLGFSLHNRRHGEPPLLLSLGPPGTHKYTRMTTPSPSHRPALTSACSRLAYSIACSGSWMLHGPRTTSSRSSSPWMMRDERWRETEMVFCEADDEGRSCRSRAGGIRGSYCEGERGEAGSADG